jgi:predicted permease
MDSLLQDLRFGVKLLWKEKGFALTVLLTLAICIGANTTIFSVINAVLLKPLPFEEPDRLVVVFNSYPGAGVERASNSAPDFFFRRERVDAFEEVASLQFWGHTVGEEGSPEFMLTMRVTPSFLAVLRVQPIIGRNFTEEEMDFGNEQKVMLSHAFWQDRYQGSESALGQDLRIDGRPYTIVGVLPEDFRYLANRETRFLVPIPFTEEDRTVERLHSNNYGQIARLAPGASIERARSQLDALNTALTEQSPMPNATQILTDAGFHTQVHGLHDDLVRDIRPTFILLWGGVAFVLLIGCVNIANLMLARSSVRMRELATRLALGAERLRLARQILTEAVMLGVMGGALGLGLGAAGLRFMETLGVESLPRGADIAVDWAVVLFTLALALAAALLFGSIPLVHVLRSDLNSVFRQEGRTGTANRRSVLVRSSLVASQVAIAFILLIGAGLLLTSFRAVLNIDPGFRPQSVLTGYLSLSSARYEDQASRQAFVDELLEDVRGLPGVGGASITSQLPFSGNNSSSVILPEGYMPEPGESLLSPYQTWVGPGYFETMGIPLLEGRLFEESDNQDAQRVIILDEWLARRYFPEASPLGKRMLWATVPGAEEDQEDHLYTVTGVVGSIKQNDLTPDDFVGGYYFTYKQRSPGFLSLVVRAGGEPTLLTPAIREAVARIDPDLPFYGVETMEERISDSLRARRSPMFLLAIFSAVALFLAAVGIYGVLAYAVTQRTREMGIRIAMGSKASDLFRMVVGQGARVVALGLLVGFAGTLALVRLIRSLLYGVAASDPLVVSMVAGLLAITGLAACLIPARRATRIDPVAALTSE